MPISWDEAGGMSFRMQDVDLLDPNRLAEVITDITAHAEAKYAGGTKSTWLKARIRALCRQFIMRMADDERMVAMPVERLRLCAKLLKGAWQHAISSHPGASY